MKKIILSAAAVMAFAFTAQAQEVKFGVKAGANFATVTGDDADDASSRTGFHVGGVVELKLTDKFSIQPELLYSMQGAERSEVEEEGGIIYTGETKAKLDYINIPIMAKYYVIEGLSIEAGPQVGFLVNAKEEVELTGTGPGGSITVSQEEDAKDFYKSVDFGLAAGAGYELPMGLFFQARYYVGLSNIGEDFEFAGATVEAADIKNSVIQLSVGFKF